MLLPHDRQAMHVCDWVLCKLQDGTPLRLNMCGFNLYTEGHFDLYIGDYYDYKVSSPSTSCSSQDKCTLALIECTGQGNMGCARRC